MSVHVAEIRWQQEEGDHFSLGRYSRVHEIAFDGGMTIQASASPSVVRAPWSQESAVDPEEMFVASLSSCHMLWFLDLARKAGLEILSYRDKAEGELGQDARGRMAMVRVTLRPEVEATGDLARIREIHEKAHEACFIASSVLTEVVVNPINRE